MPDIGMDQNNAKQLRMMQFFGRFHRQIPAFSTIRMTCSRNFRHWLSVNGNHLGFRLCSE